MATVATSEYELILMLDPEAPDELRDRIVSEARGRIEAAGTIKADSAWGMRNMAYEIRRRTEADYRFFRFESESGLLNALTHELKIADGVLRFRIFKVDPRLPVIAPPAPTPGSGPPPRPARRDAAEGAEDGPAEATPAEATPADAEAADAEPAAPPAPEPGDTAAAGEDVDGVTPSAAAEDVDGVIPSAEGEASGGVIQAEPEAPEAEAASPDEPA